MDLNIAESRWNQYPNVAGLEYGAPRPTIKIQTKILVGVLAGHCLIGRHASRLGTPYNDYCRSCHEVREEERKNKIQIKLAILMNFIRSTG